MSCHFVVDNAYPLRPDGMPSSGGFPVQFIRPANANEAIIIEAELARRDKMPTEVPESI